MCNISGRPRISEPWVMCTLCCSVMTVMYMQRRCVNEMIHLKRIPYAFRELENNTKGVCPFYYEEHHYRVGIGYWSFELVSSILQSFSLGYIMGQIPFGVITDWRGPKYPLGLGMLLSSLMCLALPYTTVMGPLWFMAGHFTMGISQSALFPCTVSAIAKWAPVSKRATWTGITVSGIHLGMSVGSSLSFQAFKLGGWEAGLFIPGLLGLAWCLPWLLFSHQPPSLSTLTRSFRVENRRVDMPWEKVLQSCPFLSLLAAFMGYNWFQYVAINKVIASYLQHVIHISMHLSRQSLVVLLAAIPTTVAGGFLSDWLVENSFISQTLSRRLFVFLGIAVPPFFLFLVPLTGCNYEAYITLVLVMLYIKGLGEAAVYCNSIDLSPKHAGMLMGIIQTLGVIVYMFARESFYVVIDEWGDSSQWQVMYTLSVSVIVIFTIPFMAYGSASEQQWRLQ